MPRFTFSLSETALRTLLVVSDQEMQFLYSVFELISEDPQETAIASWLDRSGRVTYGYKAGRFHIIFRISQHLPHVFFSDVRIE